MDTRVYDQPAASPPAIQAAQAEDIGGRRPLYVPLSLKLPFEKVKPYLFMLPAIAFVLFWTYKPLFQMVQLSFYDWSMVPGTQAVYVGLKNFSTLLRNKDLWAAAGNSAFFFAGLLPFTVVIPMLLAVGTENVHPTAKKIYRALLFVPMVLAPVSTATIFQWLFHPSYGLVNTLLVKLGVLSQGIAWFSSDPWARLIVLSITGWKMIGFGTLLYSAGLTAIDRQYYEAACLDGASKARQFFHITLPLLSSTTFVILLITVLFSSQSTFAYVDMLTQGGPYGTSTDLYYLMFTLGFRNLNVGAGEAAAVLLMFIYGTLALVMQSLSKKWVFHDN